MLEESPLPFRKSLGRSIQQLATSETKVPEIMKPNLVLLAAWLLLSLAALQAGAADENSESLFVRRIAPLLQKKCLACHGGDAKAIKGGLDLRTRQSLFKGGDSEKAAVVVGMPEKSPLYLAVTRRSGDWSAMPPKDSERLTAEQLKWVKLWILDGVPWPDEARTREIQKANAAKWLAEDGVTVKTVGGLSPEWTNRKYKSEGLWAYQPVKKPAVPARQGHPIDALIAAKMPVGFQAKTGNVHAAAGSSLNQSD